MCDLSNTPLVSVLVLCYNYENFVTETIESVINQTYSNLQIIICDNGSTDKTKSIIESYADLDTRIIPIFLSVNQGLTGNFNACIERATGEYIALHCGDDIMLPDKIQRQVQFLETHPDHVVVLHAVEVFNSTTGERIEQIGPQGVLSSPEDWFFRADYVPRERCSAFPPSSLFGRTEYLGPHRYDQRLPYKNEVLYAIDCFVSNPSGKWACLPYVLSRYRRHGDNLSGSQQMNDALLEETFVLAGIVSARYPSFANRIIKVKNTFLFRLLLSDETDLERQQSNLLLLRIEAGWFVYLFYQTCRVAKVLCLDRALFKVLRLFLK